MRVGNPAAGPAAEQLDAPAQGREGGTDPQALLLFHVVDEPALIAALREKRILTAALDVFADEPNVPAELVAMDHVVLLPHVGSGSGPTRDRMSDLAAQNLISWAAGKGPVTPVAETPWRNA